MAEALNAALSKHRATSMMAWRFAPAVRAHIRARQEAVAALGSQYETLQGRLKNIADIERIAARIAVGNARPRDLAAYPMPPADRPLLPALVDLLGP